MTGTTGQKVAIITGASQGAGAGAVQAYRKLGYVVVANSRHITSCADPGVLTVPGDIADPETGARLVDRALEHFGQVDARQQRRRVRGQANHRLHRRRL